MNKQTLEKYARLIVRSGANVQEDQDVIITAGVEDAYFVEELVKEAYEAGARKVHVEWSFQPLTKLNYQYASVEALSEIPVHEEEKLKWQVDKLPAMIHISSGDPDGLKGIDQDKMLAVQKIAGPTRRKYRQMMDNKYQWCIAGIPGKKWAMKMFPELSSEDAMEALWDAILKVTRVHGDPVENWANHVANLTEKTTKLNNLHIKTLHYTSSNGTDFTIDIAPNLLFMAADEKTLSGVNYLPNMPTEECFTSPIKTSAKGTVYSTKPLSVRGVLVKDFGFRFENGKVVEVLTKDEEAKKVLESLVSTDEGAAMLGEVALVPYDSPINQTGLLFYNTLYDENACCHLALGVGFNECIENYQNMSEEEIKAVDINESIIHVDFMIGSADLAIVATTYDNKVVQIFKDGTWAI